MQLHDDNEFDIQKTILKRKTSKNRKFFVEYNKLTNQVLKITPTPIEDVIFKHAVLEVEENDLIREIFNNKISLHKLKIKYDHESNTRILIKQYQHHRWEFDYIKSDNNPANFVFLQCDFISKRIKAIFLKENFLVAHSKEIVSESHLASLPASLDVFVADKNEPSKLFGSITLNFKQLFIEGEQTFVCHWLPDAQASIDEISFLHYNHGIKLTAKAEPADVEVTSTEYKPNIIYKQTSNKLQLQSIMESTSNFRLDDTIVLYMFDAHDPSIILDTVSLNTNKLNGFNLIELVINTTKPVKVISNYSHIHLENSNVSSYYKF